MSGLLATLGRELRVYFFSVMAYVVLAFFLFINGVFFSLIVSVISDPRSEGKIAPLKMVFGDTFLFWLVLPLITTVLTMRLVAEERKSGTIENLMTAPVTEIEVIVGKYLAALAYYAFLWLVPTIAYTAIIARSSSVDWGPIAGGYLGVVGIGAVFLAAGVFASSFARNQIVAAMVSFALIIVLFCVAFADYMVTSETLKSGIGYMNLIEHMSEFNSGIIDTRRLVYYATTVALLLFLSARTLQARKWR